MSQNIILHPLKQISDHKILQGLPSDITKENDKKCCMHNPSNKTGESHVGVLITTKWPSLNMKSHHTQSDNLGKKIVYTKTPDHKTRKRKLTSPPYVSKNVSDPKILDGLQSDKKYPVMNTYQYQLDNFIKNDDNKIVYPEIRKIRATFPTFINKIILDPKIQCKADNFRKNEDNKILDFEIRKIRVNSPGFISKTISDPKILDGLPSDKKYPVMNTYQNQLDNFRKKEACD